MGRPTVRDVARHAGVSAQTVSNVLNRRGSFSETTRARVLEAVETLGYRPSSAARSLRSDRTRQLAYHLQPRRRRAPNPLAADLLTALSTAAQMRGYRVTVFTTHDDPLRGIDDVAAARTADAFLLGDCAPDDRRARHLAARGIPFAALGRTAGDLPQSWVDIDHAAAAASLVDHLAAAGHRDIAYLGGDDDRYWTRDRRAGFLRGMARNGLRAPGALLARCSPDAAQTALHRLLAHTPRPTAVLADGDVPAAAAVNALAAEGLRGPDAVAVAAFDSGAMASLCGPPDAAVVLPTLRVAERLVDICLRQLEHPAGPTTGEVLTLPVTGRPARHG
jgi:DNA-binding LacI/PurR family transcriptional regulator